MSEGGKIGRGVFVVGVCYDSLPLSEFFGVFHVGFCVSRCLTKNFAVRSLVFGRRMLFFVIDISYFFTIAGAEDNLFVFVEFSRDGFDD